MITIVDIGARGGVGKEWDGVRHKAVLFEPDPAADFVANENWVVIRSALSDSVGKKRLYITKKGSKSSFYKPNFELINQFGNPDRFEVVKEVLVDTSTLDNELKENKIDDIDVVKLDVQGHELAILQGGRESLKKAVALEVEVEFVEMYEGQPLFGEVDAYLKSQNFELVRFLHLEPWIFEGRECLVWGEALYVKNSKFLSLEKREKLALITKTILSRPRGKKKMGLRSYIKLILSKLGLYDNEKKIKIGAIEKVATLLAHKTPELKTFIETGTNKGDTLERVKGQFDHLHSIEFDPELYKQALKRFSRDSNIKLYSGDSAVKINEILKEVDEPALIWLDAHGDGTIASNNSPIMGELKAIFSHHLKKHVILIDDARHFEAKTIRMMKGMAKENGYNFKVKNGIFRIYERG